MRTRSWIPLALALVALTQLSCATMGLVPEEPMPSARAGLAPEYRIFYDALQDYGDWTLNEPYGFVFRPYRLDPGWRPYEYGYWVPSDAYGWMWISAEPFGWATYHYGEWMYDRFQGWVWIPGADWGPAWVNWQESDDYVGWAPDFPQGFDTGLVPGGPYLYVPTAELPATDVQSRVLTGTQLGSSLAHPQPVVNLFERDGVSFNAGPRFERIERFTGPLRRVKIQDLLPAGAPMAQAGAKPERKPASPATAPSPPATAGPALHRPVPHRTPPRVIADSAAVQALRRAGEQSAREARDVAGRGGAPPASIGVMRREPRPGTPAGEQPGEAVPQERPRRTTPHAQPVVADSTKQH